MMRQFEQMLINFLMFPDVEPEEDLFVQRVQLAIKGLKVPSEAQIGQIFVHHVGFFRV
jgi:hypothetical protein